MRIAALSLVVLAGCWYDSSWGHETTAQKHNAEAAKPASFKSESSGQLPKKAKYTFKIRAWATPQYASQTLDWQHDFKEVIETANDILLKSADARIEIAGMASWPNAPQQDDLEKVLTALAAHDKSDDVDYVVGLVSGFSTFTISFHDLGAARYMSRHFALRAASDFTEHAAAEAAFNKLPPDERLRVVAERKRHRSVATFVHEIGHTLGAVHDSGKQGLMYPAYSKDMRSFGTEVSAVLAIGAAHHTDASQQPLAKELLAYYESHSSPWIDKERLALIATLKAFVPPPPAPTPAPTAAPPAFADTPKELKDSDRPAWTRAVEAFRAGKHKDAWDAGQPLFAAYPKVLYVQDLRCQIAMKIGFDWQKTKAECDQLMQLSTGK
jgi:hypothetical protein